MRTHIARRSISAALAGLLAVGGLAVAVAEQKFSVRANMNSGKPPANLPVFFEIDGQRTQVARTDAAGSFELAMDPSKNGKEFAIYRESCSEVVIRLRDPQREAKCLAQSEQQKGQDCKTSDPGGIFTWGEVGVMGQDRGGIGPKTWAGVGVLTATGIGLGIKAGGNGTPAAAASTFTLDNVPVTITATPGGTRTCNLIQPNSTATGTVTVTSDGRFTITVFESGITRTYTGTGTFTGPDTFTFTVSGPAPWTSATSRMYQTTARQGTLRREGSGAWTTATVLVSNGSAAAGPPVGCSDENVETATRR